MNVSPNMKTGAILLATVAGNVAALAQVSSKNASTIAVAMIASVALAGVAIAYIKNGLGGVKSAALAAGIVVLAGVVSNMESVRENKKLNSAMLNASSCVCKLFWLSSAAAPKEITAAPKETTAAPKEAPVVTAAKTEVAE
jgi:hypothetical protein